MEPINENRLRDLLQGHKQEVEDLGFSRRVMISLPSSVHRRSYGWIEWVFGIVGVLIAVVSGGVVEMTQLIAAWSTVFSTVVYKQAAMVEALSITPTQILPICAVIWIVTCLLSVVLMRKYNYI